MVFTFSLPFCLLLPDGEYHVQLSDSDNVVLSLKKIIPKTFDSRIGFRGLNEEELRNFSKVRLWNPNGGNSEEIDIKDISRINEMRKVICLITNDGNEVYPEWSADMQSIFINTEIPNDRYGRLRHTQVTSTLFNTEKEKRRAIDATNKLIDQYRILSGHYWIHRITEDDIRVYTIGENGVDIQGLTQFKGDIDGNLVNELNNRLQSPMPLLPHMILRSESKRAFYEGSYFLSIIYQVTALEAIVKLYIVIKSTGQSNSNIKKILQDITLPDLISKYLKPLLTASQLTPETENDLIAANRKRNDILHDFEINISREIAENITAVVDSFIITLSSDVGKK